MIEKRFRCPQCREVFVAKVFEPGEAEQRKLPSEPVRCPACRSAAHPAD